MGMFDTLFVEVDLPDGFKEESFQTKAFDCGMDYLKITKEGKLLFQDYSYEEVPEEERAGKFLGFFNRINGEWHEWHTRRGTLFHGEFNFYSSGPEPEREWHEYIAKFTDGQLIEIIADQTVKDFYEELKKRRNESSSIDAHDV